MVSETKEKIWIKNKILKTYFEVPYITANISSTVIKLFRNYLGIILRSLHPTSENGEAYRGRWL